MSSRRSDSGRGFRTGFGLDDLRSVALWSETASSSFSIEAISSSSSVSSKSFNALTAWHRVFRYCGDSDWISTTLIVLRVEQFARHLQQFVDRVRIFIGLPF